MIAFVLLAVGIQQMWYAVPLIVSVSMVYAATRHEYMGPILLHAVRFGAWICVFMAIVLAALMFMSSFV